MHSASSDTTTPLPIRHTTPSRKMPDGIRCSTVFLLADDERVPGIVSALKAHDGARAIGQHVDDGAFALVAPLRPDDDYVSTHTTLAR